MCLLELFSNRKTRKSAEDMKRKEMRYRSMFSFLRNVVRGGEVQSAAAVPSET